MSTEYLSMAEVRRILRPEFVEIVCVELAQFARYRRDGLADFEAAGLMGIDEETTSRYERAYARISGEDERAGRVLHAVGDALEPTPGLEAIRARTQESETAPEAPGAARDDNEGNPL